MKDYQREAESAWTAYVKSYSEALAAPETAPTGVQEYVTASRFKEIDSTLRNLEAGGVRLAGTIRVRSFRIDSQGEKKGTFVGFSCLDNLDSRVVDVHGSNVTPKDRPRLFTVRAVLLTVDGRLLVDKDETWNKSSAC